LSAFKSATFIDENFDWNEETLMKKTLFASLMALGFLTVFGAAYAAPDVPLYDGKTLSQDKLAISDWGGGSIADNTQLFLFGGHSLKVTTLDLYQGAKISFLNPVPLAGSDRMFQVTMQRGAITLHYDPQAVPGAGQSGLQNIPGGFRGGRGGRGRGGQFGGQLGGQLGGRFRGRQAAPLIPLITKLRLEFTLADGRQADVVETIPKTADAMAGDGWYSVNVPISSLKFGTGSVADLKSVTLAGDQYGVLFIGQIQITPETAASKQAAAAVPDEAPADDPALAMDDPALAMDDPGQPTDEIGPPTEDGPPMNDAPPMQDGPTMDDPRN
jgi:hypothetical protein